MKRVCMVLFLLVLLSNPAEAAAQRTADAISCEAMERALELTSQEQQTEWTWLELLALAAAYGEGVPSPVQVVHVHYALEEGQTTEVILNGDTTRYGRWLETCQAALGGLVGGYVELADGEWEEHYGIQAYFPIAAGYWYTYGGETVGAAQSGEQLVGLRDTPVVAVESGTVEAVGWDRQNGWQIRIRSADGRRCYRYSGLRNGRGNGQGDWVEAGQVIGLMGTSGRDTEMGILRFAMQLNDGRKPGGNRWMDVSEILRLLENSRSAVIYDEESAGWKQLHPRMAQDGKSVG